MQFLVRKTHHTTGEVFFDVTRAKENEEFIVVDAENKEEAKERVKKPRGLLECVPSKFKDNPISRKLSEKSKTYVLEIDGGYWEGEREELLQILNKSIGLDGETHNIQFVPRNEYITKVYQKGQ